jgi:hypothetical protein
VRGRIISATITATIGSEERHDVDDQAAGRDDQHRGGGHVRRVGEAGDRLDHHVDRDAGQQHGVGQRGQHFQAVETERALRVGGGPAGGGDRRQRHGDAEHVGEHVAGVGEQRQRAGHQRGGRLDQHEDGQQRRGPPEAGAVFLAGAQRLAPVVVPGSHEPYFPSERQASANICSHRYVCNLNSIAITGVQPRDKPTPPGRNHPCPDVLSRSSPRPP